MSDVATLTEQMARYCFYHCIEVASGVVTKGNEDPFWVQAPIMAALKRQDLRGKRVLDIGCRDCVFTFQAKRVGAAKVIGIDNDSRFTRLFEGPKSYPPAAQRLAARYAAQPSWPNDDSGECEK